MNTITIIGPDIHHKWPIRPAKPTRDEVIRRRIDLAALAARQTLNHAIIAARQRRDRGWFRTSV